MKMVYTVYIKSRILLLLVFLVSSCLVYGKTEIIGGIYYELNKTTMEAAVVSCPNPRIKYSGSIDIPSSVRCKGEFRVTEISKGAFEKCTELISVSFSVSIKNIDDYAFRNCINIKSIEIPECVERIGHEAFAGCVNLSDISIPNKNLEIGYRAFSSCPIREPLYNDSVFVRLPYDYEGVYEIPKVKTIANSAFGGCERLISVSISDAIVTIGDGAFENCNSLTKVVIPESVQNIGNKAFCNCMNLSSVTIPNSTKNVGVEIFSGCRMDKPIYNDVYFFYLPKEYKGEYAIPEVQKIAVVPSLIAGD